LESFHETSEEFKERKIVKNSFERLESVHFPLPVKSNEELSILDTLEKEALDQNFIKQIGHLKRKISKFLKPKKLLDKKLDGISFLLVVEEYLNIFNKGETLTISGIVQRTEAEERKFLMNHIQDWVDYYFDTNFLNKNLVEKAAEQLIEMAEEDHPNFRFEVFKKSFKYFQQELRNKEENEKNIRYKLLSKSVENINSAWPELKGLSLMDKVLEDESLQGKLFMVDEMFKTIIEPALLQEQEIGNSQIEYLKERLQIQDSNYIYLKEEYDNLEKQNSQWKSQLNRLEEEYQKIRIKLKAQKEELINLRKIKSGKSSYNVQFEILIQKNTELSEQNKILKSQLGDIQILRANSNISKLTKEIMLSESGKEDQSIAQYIKETLLKENSLLRNRVIELEKSEQEKNSTIKRLSFKKNQSNEK
jgi:hypothetical protein